MAERSDATGKAFRGSQFQFQTYVNRHGEFLERELAMLLGTMNLQVDWVSPLSSDGYREYRDAAALTKLGLPMLIDPLSKFWPRGGPVWDGLAIARTECTTVRLLIEAKSHLPELSSTCQATPISKAKIVESLRATQRELNSDEQVDWTTPYYQYANRLAHLVWLRKHVPTYLVNIYFVDDGHAPTSRQEWDTGLQIVKNSMGLPGPLEGAYELFLPAKPY